ncbi:hypothetical protein TNCV_4630851 [Trichonephila clavipes]|nr:hypothetical protein TNCV_4630851 [Trichonephila clavipes]
MGSSYWASEVDACQGVKSCCRGVEANGGPKLVLVFLNMVLKIIKSIAALPCVTSKCDAGPDGRDFARRPYPATVVLLK